MKFLQFKEYPFIQVECHLMVFQKKNQCLYIFQSHWCLLYFQLLVQHSLSSAQYSTFVLEKRSKSSTIKITINTQFSSFISIIHRLIKLTSPNLNYLILAGAIVLYVDIYFFVIPSTDQLKVTINCNVSCQMYRIQ